MEFEKLALEVSAVKAGLTPMSPHVLQGDSGTEHRFNMLFSDGAKKYAFDFYEDVTEIEVIRSFAKKLDTRTLVNIVCTGEVSDRARTLAVGYEMKILTPEAAKTFFALVRVVPRRTFG
jgi:hypothetical protein